MTIDDVSAGRFCDEVINVLNKDGAYLLKIEYTDNNELMLWLDVANDKRDCDKILYTMRGIKSKLMTMLYDYTGKWTDVIIKFRMRPSKEIFTDMQIRMGNVVA